MNENKKIKLQVTNGYYPYFDQVTRILQFAYNQDGKKISQAEFSNKLGMAERHIENLISIMTSLGLFKTRLLTLTTLGKLIAERDKFFDRVETLWALHYIVSSNPQWVVWHRVVTQVFPENEVIDIPKLPEKHFNDLFDRYSEKTIQDKLPKEIRAVLWAYVNPEFGRLNLLRKDESGNYIRTNSIEISPLAFLACVVAYKERVAPLATALLIDEIARKPNSPGMVLNLPELTVRSLLDQAHDSGLIQLEQFGDLDQVRFGEGLTKEKVLQKIYEA